MFFLPEFESGPMQGPPPFPVKYVHLLDIQGRVGCTTNGIFHPISAIEVYLSGKESLNERDWGMMDMHGSNDEGEFRVDGASYGLFTHPTSYIGIVLACDAIDFEKQFRLCNLSCPTGKAWRVRKQLPYSDNTGHGSYYAFRKCQMDLDLAQGVVADHDNPQKLLSDYEHRDHEKEIRPACIVK